MTNLGLDETLSEYARSLPRNTINLESITQYLNFVDEYKSGRKFQIELVTTPELILDTELQLLSPNMQSLQLNPASIATTSQAFTAFRDCIDENQLYATK